MARRVLSMRGFTLIELVVVWLLVGLVLSMAAVTAFPSGDRALRTEADRLAQLWTLAYDEAQLSGQTVVWEADLDGYRFLRRAGTSLTPITQDAALRARAWPVAPVRVSAGVEAMRVNSTAKFQLAFERSGTGDPFSVWLQHGEWQVHVRGDGLGNFSVDE